MTRKIKRKEVRKKRLDRRRKAKPGAYKTIREELHNAFERVRAVAERRHKKLLQQEIRQKTRPEKEAKELEWNEIQAVLGVKISPRYEDREFILAGLRTLPLIKNQERELQEKRLNLLRQLDALKTGEAVPAEEIERQEALVKGIEQKIQTRIAEYEVLQELVKERILEKALYRVPSIHTKGWEIRLRLQEFLARSKARLELVGRGENKIGYVNAVKNDVERMQAEDVAPEKIVIGAGYPTDLVVQKKEQAVSRSPKVETWLVEIEPRGLSTSKIGAKIRRINEALQNRFEILAEFRHQMASRPDEPHAIVFYTGTHPTLTNARRAAFLSYANVYRPVQGSFLQQQQGVSPSIKEKFLQGIRHLESLLYRLQKTEGGEREALRNLYDLHLLAMTTAYRSLIRSRFDQHNLLEDQIQQAVNDPDKRKAILESQLPVYLLAPLHGKPETERPQELHLIDLKKVALLFAGPEEVAALSPDAREAHTALTLRRPLFKTPRFIPRLNGGLKLHTNTPLLDLNVLREAGAMRRLGKIRWGAA